MVHNHVLQPVTMSKEESLDDLALSAFIEEVMLVAGKGDEVQEAITLAKTLMQDAMVQVKKGKSIEELVTDMVKEAKALKKSEGST